MAGRLAGPSPTGRAVSRPGRSGECQSVPSNLRFMVMWAFTAPLLHMSTLGVNPHSEHSHRGMGEYRAVFRALAFSCVILHHS